MFELKKMICDTLILEQINNRYTGLDEALTQIVSLLSCILNQKSLLLLTIS